MVPTHERARQGHGLPVLLGLFVPRLGTFTAVAKDAFPGAVQKDRIGACPFGLASLQRLQAEQHGRGARQPQPLSQAYNPQNDERFDHDPVPETAQTAMRA